MLILHHILVFVYIFLNVFGELLEEIAFEGYGYAAEKADVNITVLKDAAEIAPVAKHLP